MVRVKSPDSDAIPGLTEQLVAHLEELFPPRCLGELENVSAHHRYAGKAELVQSLRMHLDAQSDDFLPSNEKD